MSFLSIYFDSIFMETTTRQGYAYETNHKVPQILFLLGFVLG